MGSEFGSLQPRQSHETGAQRGGYRQEFGGLLGGDSREQLYEYYTKKIIIEQDPTTQVTRLSVRARSTGQPAMWACTRSASA